MADVLPKNRAAGPLAKSPKPLEPQDTGKLSIKGDGSLNNAKLSAKLRSPTAAPSPQSNDSPAQNASSNSNTENRRQPEAAMDPLSQQILQRTNTAATIPKLRSQTTDSVSVQSPTQPNDGHADTKYTGDATRELGGASKADKKKGVSFLSRFIGGNKRKGALGATGDDASETGDARPEGMDAQLFSHTVDNFGFSPRHPQPPAYIKVRSKFKKDKEFDRLFLAQELRTGATKKSSPATGSSAAPQSGAAALQNPIWAIEFSKDGKYMAAGGSDRIVRVWAVISSPEERRTHERHESDPNTTGGGSMRLSAPVFQQKTFREYHGHTATILDLSFSKNNFLLSSGMDKTVRLWHVSRSENLCTFKHSDFVPSIQFHPKDDRFFLAGSLDNKLRLWSIPDKSVAYWTQLNEMITAVTFTPDGKTCVAGTVGGLCVFFETEGLKWNSQLHVKSTRGQNAKGSKITGIQTIENEVGEVKLLVSSNDSRIRIYNLKDKSLEMKIRGHENNCSQIRASFASDTGHIICGSEDRKAYIWSAISSEGYQKYQSPVEIFEAHNTITTCAIIAPLKTRQLLSTSEDPVYDLCNPPPVTLLSREESSVNGSRAPTEAGSVQPTPLEATFKRVAESPAYIARSAHHDGNIIITSDYTGSLKVFRQDCAYLKRMRDDGWDSSSIFSKRTSKIGRPSSILSRGTGRSRRDSTSTQPPHDRIMSWRQDISHGGFDSPNGTISRKGHGRSTSPRKSRAPLSIASTRTPNSPSLAPTSATDAHHPVRKAGSEVSITINDTPMESTTTQSQPSTRRSSSNNNNNRDTQNSSYEPLEPLDPKAAGTDANPLSIYNGQSWAFWNISGQKKRHEQQQKIQQQRDALAPLENDEKRPGLSGRLSTVSKLSSEMSEHSGDDDDEQPYQCKSCGAEEFKVRVRGLGGHEERFFVCGVCGVEVE